MVDWSFGSFGGNIPIVGIWHDHANTKNQAEDRFFGSLRHKFPEACCWNSQGQMILLRFGKYGLLPLSTNMLDGMNDWAKTRPLVTDKEVLYLFFCSKMFKGLLVQCTKI
jgi:hypothetical protein